MSPRTLTMPKSVGSRSSPKLPTLLRSGLAYACQKFYTRFGLSASDGCSSLANTTPCLNRKTCQLFVCFVFVEYEQISSKLGRYVMEWTFNKTMHKMPTSPKYVLALPWEIWSDSVHFKFLMNHWIATNTTGSCSLKNCQTFSNSHHLCITPGRTDRFSFVHRFCFSFLVLG